MTAHTINRAALPALYPTNRHEPIFWEALGRAVAAFGFLEEVLLRAIFAISATTPYEDDEFEAAYEAWVQMLTRSVSDPLGNLIDTFGKTIKKNTGIQVSNFDDLVEDLRKACKLRNAICHGSWRPPDSEGLSIPFYVNKQGEIFDTPMGVAQLAQVRTATSDLACAVIETVTFAGWQFPGSTGPGHEIWPSTVE